MQKLYCALLFLLPGFLAPVFGQVPADTIPPVEVKADTTHPVVQEPKTDSLRAAVKREIEKLQDRKRDLRSQVKNAQTEYERQQAQTAELLKTVGVYMDSVKVKRDSLLNNLKELEAQRQQTETQKSNASKTLDSVKQRLATVTAEIAATEDSLEVIARITLKPKAKVHLDRQWLIDDLKKLDKCRKSGCLHDTICSQELVQKRIDLMNVLSIDKGFRLFPDSVIRYMAVTQDYSAIPLRFVKEVDIEKVNIDVSEGVIREIIVKTNKYGIFRNTRSPINLVNIGERLDDKLWRDGEKMYQHEYLLLGETIEYVPHRSFNDLPYTQFQILLLPDSGKRSYLIRESTSLNTYFDLAIYTDIKGISGGANGLAQVSGSARFITHTRNVRGQAVVWGNYVSFTGNAAKFDKSFKGSDLMAGDSISRRDLLQRSIYSLGVKANIVRFLLHPLPKRLIQDMQLNAGINFTGSNVLRAYVKDSSAPNVLDTSYSVATQQQIYIEPLVSFTRYRNFNMALSIPVSLISVMKSAGVSNRYAEIWARPSIDLMYYAKKNSSSKIFFRYNHWINLREPENAFFQLQLGYSANITDLFAGK